MTARTGALVAALAAVLTLSACLPPLDQVSPDDGVAWPGGTGTSGGDPSGSDVYSQQVDWKACGKLECATIQVPLNWQEPDGQTIELALNRYRSPSQGKRLGTVVINPGGPGGSGIEFTSYFADFAGKSLLEHYDVVGFDPRGVGQSSPVKCGSTAELDAYYLHDAVANTEADIKAQVDANAAFAARCRELTGPLIENVDTASAARDMDVIRALVGDEKLNYLGFSYGTQLGATYAVLYPQNVGKMVLDGAVDFLLPPTEMSETQAQGFELALENYINDCISNTECPLPRDLDLAKKTVRDLIAEARDQGFPSSEGDVNGTLMIYGIVFPLYQDQYWQYLSQALDEALNVGTADLFHLLADAYLSRDENGDYLDNSSEAFTAIGCLDTPPQDPLTVEDMRAYQKSAERLSPTFGWWFSGSVGCEGWPWVAHQQVTDLSPGERRGGHRGDRHHR